MLPIALSSTVIANENVLSESAAFIACINSLASCTVYGKGMPSRRLSSIFLLFSCGILCQTYIEKTCLLYDNSLRFHVRADSDEKEAQERKLIVRDAILQYVKTDVEQAHSAGELKQTLAKKTKQIARIAAKAADGKPVRVYFTQERFPIRHYGAAIFPAGEYQALRIDIGKAQGHNWWCAFYPKLCYIPEKKVNLFPVSYTHLTLPTTPYV